MSVDLWQAAAAAMVAGVLGAWFSRWWYGRAAEALARELTRLESEVQAGAKALARARKQTDELQRLVAEYRRRLNAAEVARRRVDGRPTPEEAPRQQLPAEPAEPEVAEESQIASPRSWADTQPFESN